MTKGARVLYGGDARRPPSKSTTTRCSFAAPEKFHASILEMEIDGRSEQVLLRDFQMHPYRPLVMHVDFQRISADKPIHMRVPLHFVGQENSPA